jgi:hypothetical protein
MHAERWFLHALTCSSFKAKAHGVASGFYKADPGRGFSRAGTGSWTEEGTFMIGFLDVRHIRHFLAQEKETTRSRDGRRGGRPREAAAQPAARPGAAGRDELAAFGLCDAVSADGPASLKTLSQASDSEGLEAHGLLRTDTPKPRGPESLADASPYDFLLYLGLMG